MDHTGLGMHYVNGVPRDEPFPPVLELLSGTDEAPAPYDYASLAVMKQPGSRFGYSGGGFLILQHLLECREAQPASELMNSFLRGCGTAVSLGLTFDHEPPASKHVASGFYDGFAPVPHGRKSFPPLAAGALGSAAGLADWLRQLALAYRRPQGCGAVSHAAARTVLSPSAAGDLGSDTFMGAAMGVGMFVFDSLGADGRASRWMLHQAANDGFRGVLLVCFDGPDAEDGPRGFVILANGDNAAVGLVSDVARALLTSAATFRRIRLDWSRVPSEERGPAQEEVRQEEIVNRGLKERVLNAFVKPATGPVDACAPPPAALPQAPPVAAQQARGARAAARLRGLLGRPGGAGRRGRGKGKAAGARTGAPPAQELRPRSGRSTTPLDSERISV